MRYAKEVFWHYPMFRHRSATPAGVTDNGEVRSLGNNVTSILGSVVNAPADAATASIRAVGGPAVRGKVSVTVHESRVTSV
jgi:hypothetical protein